MKYIIDLIQLLNIQQKKILLLFIPLTLILIILETFSIGLIIPIITSVLGDNQSMSLNVRIEKYLKYFFENLTILNLCIIIISVFFAKNIFFSLYNLYLFKFSNSIQLRLSKSLLRVYISTPYLKILHKDSAEMLRNLQSECAKVRNAIRYSIILFSETLVLLSIIFLIILVDVKSATSVIIYLFSIIIVYFLIFKNLVVKLGFQNQKVNRIVIKSILETVESSRLIRILSNQKFFLNKYDSQLKKFLRNNVFVSFMNLLPRVWIEIFVIIGICILIYFLTNSNFDKNYVIVYIGLISFALIRIIPSIMRISNSYQQLRYTTASVEKIKNDLNLKKFINKDGKMIKNFSKSLILSNVSFSYKETDKEILKNINLSIKKNECILIKGESGSGKTTLVNIISGLIKPNKGNFLLDDQEIDFENIKWGGNLGYVAQDTFVLDDEIKANIAFGIEEENINLDKVNEVIDQVQLRSYIDTLNEGIYTTVGERGARISGGQAQRLGIARALYREPNILIFDEATSSLDKENERKIYEILNKMKKSLTIIVISHNPIDTLNFDKRYELKNGNLTTIQ